MTKFTSQEKAEIKNIVKNCNVMGLTDNQTLDQIKIKTGKDITFRQLSNIKSEMKRDTLEWINNIFSTPDNYIALYIELIDTLDACQNKLVELYDSSKDKPNIQARCLKQMVSFAKTREQIYNRCVEIKSNGSSITTTN
jgi:hypothetical protein